MISFKQYFLLEDDASPEVKEKLKHLEHIEELIVNEGSSGAQRALSFLSRIINVVSGGEDKNLAVNLKIDGAPSLVCGPIPKGEQGAGEFFVGTKSALSPTGKRYTKNDMERIGAENSAGLAEKLTAALRYLPALGMKEIYQGDFLFTPGDLIPATIEDKNYLTFKPNTITYAVEARSKAGDEVRRAKMGIVFHTVYQGDTFTDMHATFNPNLSQLKETPDVWWKSNRIQDFGSTMPQKVDGVGTLQAQLQKAKETFSQIDPGLFEAMANNPQLAAFIKMHLNSKVRQNELVGHVEQHIDQLAGFIDRRHQMDMDKFKTDKKKAQVAQSQQQYGQLMQKLRPELIKMFSFFNQVTDIKLTLLDSVGSFGGLSAFFKEGNKYTKTAGEGLVLADTKSHEITKIIDRLTFAQQNFNMPKDW